MPACEALAADDLLGAGLAPALAHEPRSPQAEAPRHRAGRAAFAAALALHAALAFAFFDFGAAVEADEEAGASAIEVSVEMAGPQTQTDAPSDPDAAASTEAPDIAKTEQAPIEERPNADPPADEIVAREPEKQESAPPSIAAVASFEGAAPALPEAPPAPVARAPRIGSPASIERAVATWKRKLAAHLERHKAYPADGARRSAEVAVRFTVARDGRIVSAAVLQSSGLPAFDAAALTMLKRADPAPAPPRGLDDDGLTFTAPIVFRAR